MDIKLQTLDLKDFMGGTFTLPANCEDVNVYGCNGSGKTRVINALSWLLFDKDSFGRADFEIKNLDAEGNEEHGLEHTVEGTFFVDSQLLTLKKIYKENWTKKRGSPKAVHTGHTTDHFVNDIPVQKKDFVNQVAELAGDESVFRLLTSPTAFPLLHWQKQRALLLEICGDITDLQVIESNPELHPLIELLAKYSKSKKPFDDMKAIIISRRKEINEQLEKIPVRIDEVKKGMTDITGLDRKEIDADVIRLEAALNDTKLKLHGIDNGSDIADLSKRLAGVKADIQKLEVDHYNKMMAEANKVQREITDLSGQKANHERRSKSIKADIEVKQSRLAFLDDQRKRLLGLWEVINAEQFQDTTEDICPACGQALPSEQVAEAREKARGEFNQRKADRLADIQSKGRAGNAEKDAIAAELMALHKELTDGATASSIVTRMEELQAEYENFKKQAEDYTAIPERAELFAVRDSYEQDIRAARESVQIDRAEVAREVEALTAQLQQAKNKADLFPKRFAGEKRIAELKDEDSRLNTEYTELEKQLYLCETFIRTKVGLLNERINAKFEIVKFKLFEVQVNGGLSECCTMTINGVPYEGGLNNAAKIQGGLDIIRTLQAHYGLKVPIMIDNRESVTEIPTMHTQVISLVVSPEDKTLRVEKAVESKKAA